MHRLQQHILGQLINNPSLRYAQLKPASVEGNLFMYHLRALMKQGLIEKRADGQYELSPEGKRYADTLSLETFTPRLQPRFIILVACQNEAGEWLFHRRVRQPVLGWVGFPHLDIVPGKQLLETVRHGFKELTGLTAGLEHRGDGYITLSDGQKPESQVFFHLFVGSKPHGTLRPKSAIGTLFWGASSTIDETYLPSVPDLIKLMKEHPKDRFFCELEYQV